MMDLNPIAEAKRRPDAVSLEVLTRDLMYGQETSSCPEMSNSKSDRKKQGQFGHHSRGSGVDGYDVPLPMFSSNDDNRVLSQLSTAR